MIVAFLGHKTDDFDMENYAARSKESDFLYSKEKVSENHVLRKNTINPREEWKVTLPKYFFFFF